MGWMWFFLRLQVMSSLLPFHCGALTGQDIQGMQRTVLCYHMRQVGPSLGVTLSQVS